MNHILLAGGLVAASLAPAAAQGEITSPPRSLHAQRVPGPTRDAGIYHVSTGTWTRRATAVASFGPDVIYSNTAQSGYFSTAGGTGGFAPGATNYDQGSVPGSANPGYPGVEDTYQVNCITIGYCDNGAPGTGGWELGFYNSYAPCEGVATPDVTINVSGLPAASGCWSVNIDLSGGPELCLATDGGNGFDDDLDLDSFGWSYRYTGTDGAGAGFLLTGDPRSTDPNWMPGTDPKDATNTIFGPPSLCTPDDATGLLTQDQWYLDDPANDANDGCYFFGGYGNNNGCGGPANAYASYSIELLSDGGGTCNCFCGFCSSNPNSTGVNSTMTLTGSLSVAQDDVTLTATVPPNVFGFFITSQTAGFIANPGGSTGNICLGANIGRFQQLASNSGVSGVIAISTTAGQWSLSAIPQATGAYAAVAGQQAYFQLWHRDSSPTGPTSNLTDGLAVTWQP